MIRTGLLAAAMVAVLVTGQPWPMVVSVIGVVLVLLLPSYLVQAHPQPRRFPGRPAQELPEEVAQHLASRHRELLARGFTGWGLFHGPHGAATGWWLLLRHDDGVRSATLFTTTGRRNLTPPMCSVGLALVDAAGIRHAVEVSDFVPPPVAWPPTAHVRPAPGADADRLLALLSAHEAAVGHDIGAVTRLALPADPLQLLSSEHAEVAEWNIAHDGGRVDGQQHYRVGERAVLRIGLAALPGISHLRRRRAIRSSERLLAAMPPVQR